MYERKQGFYEAGLGGLNWTETDGAGRLMAYVFIVSGITSGRKARGCRPVDQVLLQTTSVGQGSDPFDFAQWPLLRLQSNPGLEGSVKPRRWQEEDYC